MYNKIWEIFLTPISFSQKTKRYILIFYEATTWTKKFSGRKLCIEFSSIGDLGWVTAKFMENDPVYLPSSSEGKRSDVNWNNDSFHKQWQGRRKLSLTDVSNFYLFFADPNQNLTFTALTERLGKRFFCKFFRSPSVASANHWNGWLLLDYT